MGRTPAAADAFVDALHADGIAARAGAASDAEVVVCLTTSRQPVLPDTLPPPVLVVGVGAFTPQMAEIPPGIARARRVVVDDLGGARHEAGDLIQAAIDWDGVVELADCLEGPLPAAPHGFVWKTVGHATWDLAAARVAVDLM